MYKILIIEDEETIRRVERLYLEKAGYLVDVAKDGLSGIKKFNKDDYNLIILDLNLPHKDGIEVCRSIRQTSKVPIIMVTARVTEIEELLGLEMGADDYIKKPFDPKILVARVKVIMKRFTVDITKIGNLEINPSAIVVKKDGNDVKLTSLQFDILYTLASNKGKVYKRYDLLEAVYKDEVGIEVFDRTIDVHIRNIRKKIEDDTKDPKYILTVIGKGYKFNENI